MTAILMTAGKARVCLQCHRELVVSCGPNGPRCAQRIRGAVAMALSMADRFGYTAEQIEAAGELLADGGIVEFDHPGHVHRGRQRRAALLPHAGRLVHLRSRAAVRQALPPPRGSRDQDRPGVVPGAPQGRRFPEARGAVNPPGVYRVDRIS